VSRLDAALKNTLQVRGCAVSMLRMGRKQRDCRVLAQQSVGTPDQPAAFIR
jgi:hypothetical protein